MTTTRITYTGPTSYLSLEGEIREIETGDEIECHALTAKTLTKTGNFTAKAAKAKPKKKKAIKKASAKNT